MLTILEKRPHSFCDGVSRRQFLRIGSLGLGGVSLASILRAEAQSGPAQQPNSVVMIYLPGGPTQHETFDPKPAAPSEIRGSFAPRSTRIPGIHLCELLPELSAIADRFSVVRTLVGMENRHESFQCYAGRPGGRNEDREPAGGWPTFGSVASRVLGPGPGGMVPYVDVSPTMSYRPYRNRGIHDPSGKTSWPGFTGQSHAPFALEGDVKEDLVLQGVDLSRLGGRRDLLAALNRCENELAGQSLDSFQEQAFGLLTSSRLARALDVEREPRAARERYGATQATHPSFGGAPQSPERLLLTRRLIEAGVRCVSVAFGAWDWHANREGTIEFLSKKYLPVFDHAVATFLLDLDERGLLDQTMVIIWGEFGRTPRINSKGGRDHWPGTQSVLLAGGGIRGGRVVGRTDRVGGTPADRPVHVQEIFATLYHGLGIDIRQTKIQDLNGRPHYLVDEGRQPIRELLT